MNDPEKFQAHMEWGRSKTIIADDRADAFAYHVAKQVETWVSCSSGKEDIRITIVVNAPEAKQ